MKQHITPKQARELTENQFYSLFNEIVPRKDWYSFHHRKVTIGKMIEVLQNVSIESSNQEWVVNKKYRNKELTDALWEAVKDLIIR